MKPELRMYENGTTTAYRPTIGRRPRSPLQSILLVLGGVIKEWKLGVAKQGLLKSGDPNVWKTKGIVGHYKPALVALSYGL